MGPFPVGREIIGRNVVGPRSGDPGPRGSRRIAAWITVVRTRIATYAMDFIAVRGRRTATTRDWRTLLSTEPVDRFVAFGQPILAPAAGRVVAVHDGEADHVARRSPFAPVCYALTQRARVRGRGRRSWIPRIRSPRVASRCPLGSTGYGVDPVGRRSWSSRAFPTSRRSSNRSDKLRGLSEDDVRRRPAGTAGLCHARNTVRVTDPGRRSPGVEDGGGDGVDVPALESFGRPAAFAYEHVVVADVHGEPEHVGGGVDGVVGS